jgi:hypothetical protein
MKTTNSQKKPVPLAFVDVDRVTHETDEAIRIITAGDQDHWIPKALIQRGTEVESPGDDGLLVLPAWFTTKELIPIHK